MTSVKRTASQAHLANRAPKIARTTMHRSDFEPNTNASPSQFEGLVDRWGLLFADTIKYLGFVFGRAYALEEPLRTCSFFSAVTSEESLPIYESSSRPPSSGEQPTRDTDPPLAPPKRPPQGEESPHPVSLSSTSVSNSLHQSQTFSTSSTSSTRPTSSMTTTVQLSFVETPATSTFQFETSDLKNLKRGLSRSRSRLSGFGGVFKRREHIHGKLVSI